MNPAACREPYARNLVRPEFEELLTKLDDFRDGFVADLHAMERRMIRTMVCTMLGGVLTIAVIGLIVSVSA
ncbi:MAG: hypothetical protein F4Z08_03645 [Chloroflexi bacterium]|nr:hypothetical protein [Chloroflexota bacterium]